MQQDTKTEKTFLRYVQMREGVAVSTAGGSNFDSLESTEVKELLRVVWDRYKGELKEFFNDLAERNDDEELRELLKKIGGSGQDMDHFKKDLDKDEIRPSLADTGGDDEF